MKVVVYLPALNEAETIGAVLDGIPSRLPGIESIRTIVVDDGSTDATGAIAQRHGAAVVQHRRNLGTGKTFVSGVSAALRAGADIIVSMDADGQFRGEDVARLIAPIREGRADVVLCSRFADGNLVGDMSWRKMAGNRLLTGAVSWIAGTRFTDVSCGFRAMSREAALRVDIHSDYEYIHESLLNWSRVGLTIEEVALPVLAERPVGESRIMRSVLRYAMRSGPVLIRATRDYSPMKFFGLLSLAALAPGLLAGLFVTLHWLRTGETAPYTSLITISVGGVLLGLLLGVVALLADLIARLRFQLEEMLYESRRSRLDTPTIRKVG
ncbi:MAG: glycosyltransferase family 2 protein [Vicinamibacterales bacterium]